MDHKLFEKYTAQLKEIYDYQRVNKIFDDDMSKMLTLFLLDQMGVIQERLSDIHKEMLNSVAVSIDLDKEKIAEGAKVPASTKETGPVIKKILKKPQPSKRRKGKK